MREIDHLEKHHDQELEVAREEKIRKAEYKTK